MGIEVSTSDGPALEAVYEIYGLTVRSPPPRGSRVVCMPPVGTSRTAPTRLHQPTTTLRMIVATAAISSMETPDQ